MTDSSPPRPTLKLNLKPTILESLASKLPKQIIAIPEKVEPKNSVAGKEAATPNNKINSQATVVDKPKPAIPKQEQQKIDKKPKQTQKPKKEKIPPPVLQPYDFFEVYGKLHADFRSVISLKAPAALAIGISKDIKQASGLSKKNTSMWIAEYLRRSLYYKRGHLAGANRYNLQGEITGIVTQEQYEAGQAIFRKVGRRLRKARQSPQETNQ